MTAVPSPVIEFTDVVKTYPTTPPVRALDWVSLRIEAGELLAILGQSGSGKSTLLNLAGALDRPSTGTVRIGGDDISRLGDPDLSSVRGRRIGFVFQQFMLIEALSAVGNVATGLLYRGLPAKVRRSRAETALERVGLSHRRQHRPGELSGGEQQRVAIARALVGEPSIILADEPTGNLDSVTSRQLVNLLQALNREGTTIAVVTHDRDLANPLPRVVTIHDGRISSDVCHAHPRS